MKWELLRPYSGFPVGMNPLILEPAPKVAPLSKLLFIVADYCRACWVSIDWFCIWIIWLCRFEIWTWYSWRRLGC